MTTKTLVAKVKDSRTGRMEFITRDRDSKSEYHKELMQNGYTVKAIYTKDHFEWIAQGYISEEWQLSPKYYKYCMEHNAGQPADWIDYKTAIK